MPVPRRTGPFFCNGCLWLARGHTMRYLAVHPDRVGLCGPYLRPPRCCTRQHGAKADIKTPDDPGVVLLLGMYGKETDLAMGNKR